MEAKTMVTVSFLILTLCGCSAKTCDDLVVGNNYTICSPKDNNPFEERTVANVIITEKRDGFVQYCWAHEINKPGKMLYNRSCKDFVFLMNECK